MRTDIAANNSSVETLKSHQGFASDVLEGLSGAMKALPCKYIYDGRGSLLFSRITELPEYYLTRSEIEIFLTHREAIGDLMAGEECNLIELGAGDGTKTRILFDHLHAAAIQFRYYPVDISENSVKGLTAELAGQFPSLKIHGIISDYFEGLQWLCRLNRRRNIVLFLGSSIGNFDPDATDAFLSALRDELNNGDLVLIGFDLKKDIDLVLDAYNDAMGITEQFNLNILKRVNEELGGNFDLDKFRYYCTWDAFCGAVKSFLISVGRQTVHIRELKRSFQFGAWEPIHTESSYKFSEEDISELAERNGFDVIGNFYDKKKYFVDTVWRVRKETR